MQDAFAGTELLVGHENMEKLSHARIAVFGLGSVGSYVVEALARCGVGSLTLIDGGVISEQEINKQLYALSATIGKSKVQIAKERITEIDSDILVHTYDTWFGTDTAELFEFRTYDYIIDTFRNTEHKALLIQKAEQAKIPVISSLDLANCIRPEKLQILDINRCSSVQGRELKKELRTKGIHRARMVTSKENVPKTQNAAKGNIAYIPGIAGYMMAGYVARDLMGMEKRREREILSRKRKKQ